MAGGLAVVPISEEDEHQPAVTTTAPICAQPSMLRVLLVEDDPLVRATIRRRFVMERITVVEVGSGELALEAFSAAPPDLVLLDLVLPGLGGLSVLQELRRVGDVPVILLSGLAEEADRVAGLELGADDYVTKPFSPRELLARVRCVLRRYRGPATDALAPIVLDGLRIDPVAREVLVAGMPVALTRLEFDLLVFLASSPRQVFSRAQLLEHVWGSQADWQDEATVTEHIHRLRQRVEHGGSHRIRTLRGVGYRFEP